MTVRILQGDCRQVLKTLPDCSVHAVITSPPYWGLRAYLKAGHKLKKHEIGSEPTIDEHVRVLVEVFREVRRVLRDDGTLWINYGDAYNAQSGQRKTTDSAGPKQCSNEGSVGSPSRAAKGLKPGDLIGLPWRLAFALQADGWWLRQDNVWSKPAPMPESVNGWRWEKHQIKVAPAARAKSGTYAAESSDHAHGARDARDANGSSVFTSTAKWVDCPGCPKCSKNSGLILRKGAWRTTRAHEYIFQFAKSAEYFCDAEAAKEESVGVYRTPGSASLKNKAAGLRSASFPAGDGATTRNPRSVWVIGPEPCSDAHFAVFPSEIPRRIITAATSEKGVCASCGSPWVRVIEKKKGTPDACRGWDTGDGAHSVKRIEEYMGKNANNTKNEAHRRLLLAKAKAISEGRTADDLFAGTTTIGWRPSCDCRTDQYVAATVLDPFGGKATVGETAESLGRHSIIVELNPDYVELAKSRTRQIGLFT